MSMGDEPEQKPSGKQKLPPHHAGTERVATASIRRPSQMVLRVDRWSVKRGEWVEHSRRPVAVKVTPQRREIVGGALAGMKFNKHGARIGGSKTLLYRYSLDGDAQ